MTNSTDTRLLSIISDIGISPGPNLNATVKYCNSFDPNGLLNEHELELVVSSYSIGWQSTIVVDLGTLPL